jgi:hypothetical protein
MQLRPHAHQDGIAHVCVVVCLPFSLDVGWRFDSSVFDEDCYFSTVKDNTVGTQTLLANFSNDVQHGSIVAFAATSKGGISHLHVSSMSSPRDHERSGLQGTAFSNSTEYSAVRVVQNFWDEIRFICTYCSYSIALGTLSSQRLGGGCKIWTSSRPNPAISHRGSSHSSVISHQISFFMTSFQRLLDPNYRGGTSRAERTAEPYLLYQ